MYVYTAQLILGACICTRFGLLKIQSFFRNRLTNLEAQIRQICHRVENEAKSGYHSGCRAFPKVRI